MHTGTTRSSALHLHCASGTRASPYKLLLSLSRLRCRPERSRKISERIRFFGSTKTIFGLHSRASDSVTVQEARDDHPITPIPAVRRLLDFFSSLYGARDLGCRRSALAPRRYLRFDGTRVAAGVLLPSFSAIMPPARGPWPQGISSMDTRRRGRARCPCTAAGFRPDRRARDPPRS